MKKYIGIMILLTILCFFPGNAEAISKKDKKKASEQIVDYIDTALKNNSFKVKNSGGDYYDVRLKIGSEKTKKLKDAFDKVGKKTSVIISICMKQSSCSFDNQDFVLTFSLKKEKDGTIYLMEDSLLGKDYINLRDSSSLHYYITTPSKDVKKDGSLTLKIDDSNVDKVKGKEASPHVITTSDSITIPQKDDSFWNGMDIPCYYIKFDYSSQNQDSSFARYLIEPADLAERYIFWANDPQYRLANTIIEDEVDKGYFPVYKSNYYGICASDNSIYGKTFNFTYKDTKDPNTANHIQDEAVKNQDIDKYYESHEPDYSYGPDYESLYDDKWNPKNGCEILKEGKTVDVLLKILNYLRIGAVALLLVLGSIDFASAIISDKDDAMKSAGTKFKKRLIACVIVFLVPTLVNLVLYAANKSETICNIFSGGETSENETN